MRVGINARLLANPKVGIGQYTANLIDQIAKDHPEDEIVLIVAEKIKKEFPANVKIKVIPEKKCLISGSLKKGFWEHFQVRKYLKKQKFDLVFFTYPAYPICGTKTPSVTVVHDIIPWQDARYRRKLRSKIYFWLTGKALKKAPKFIAVSQTTKDALAEHFKIDPKKITVTYEAASPGYLQKTSTANCQLPVANYLLYVGGYDKRKNVDKLIEIFQRLKVPELQLILVGGKLQDDKLYDSHDLQKEGKNTKLNILKTGFVSEKELSKLYKEAVAVINISGQEGFNLPLLEAAYSGTPIITSDIPVHREIYGRHAFLLSPGQEVEQIKNFLADKQLQQKYREETKALREKYTWEKAAKKTYEVWQMADENYQQPTLLL